jgi:hypothetical protein
MPFGLYWAYSKLQRQDKKPAHFQNGYIPADVNRRTKSNGYYDTKFNLRSPFPRSLVNRRPVDGRQDNIDMFVFEKYNYNHCLYQTNIHVRF